MKKFKRLIAVMLCIVLCISCFAGCGKKNNTSYRTIAVSEVNGTTNITRGEKENFDAYAGVHLLSGDDAQVRNSSDMTMELDNDKHVYAGEGTHFYLTADGEEGSTKTVINLEAGSVLIAIDNKLGANESFSVDTPNSTMAARGTVFYVKYDLLTNTTIVETFEGSVEVTIKDQDETKAFVNAGQTAYITTQIDDTIAYSVEEGNDLSVFNDAALAKLVSFGIALEEISELVIEGEDITASWGNVTGEESRANIKYWEKLDISDWGNIDPALVERNEKGQIERIYSDNYKHHYIEFGYHDTGALAYNTYYSTVNGEIKTYRTIEYDANGNVISSISDENAGKSLYTYYEDGTLASYEYYVNVVDRYSSGYSPYTTAPDFRYFSRSEYDEHGNLDYEETYDYVARLTSGGDMFRYDLQNTYDAEGKLLYTVDGPYIIYYEYDDHGNMIHNYVIDTETGEKYLYGEGDITYKYEFIAGEYRVVRSDTIRDGEEYVGSVEYTYDENGLVIEEISVDSYDDWEGLQTTTGRRTYTYDEYGNVISDIFVSETEYTETVWESETEYEEYTGSYGSREEKTYSYDYAAFPAGTPGQIFARTVNSAVAYDDEMPHKEEYLELFKYKQ